MSTAYIDKYSALYEKNYGYDPQSESPGKDYGSWDQAAEYETDTSIESTGDWDESFYEEEINATMESSEDSWDDPAYRGEDLGGDVMEETQAPTLSQAQQRRLDRLQKKQAQLETDFQETQEEFFNLEQGLASPEEKSKQLESIQKELNHLIDDLEDVENLEKKLNKDGVKTDDGLEDDPLLGNDPEYDEMLSDPDSTDEMRKNIEEMKSGLDEETSQVAKQIRGKEIQAEISELQNVKTEGGQALQEEFIDAMGYLNGSKDKHYFVGKIGSDGKHIFKYHESATKYASEVLSTMGEAAISGDWESVTTLLDSIDRGWVDDSLSMVHTILSEHYPDLLNKIPSSISKSMHDNIKRGDNPGSSGVHYLYGRSLKYGPKNHKRRRDMNHAGGNYESSANAWLSLSNSTKGPEEANQKRIEELQKELNELGVETYPEWEEPTEAPSNEVTEETEPQN